MALTAARLIGDQFSAKDLLEIRLDKDGNNIAQALYKIEKVSGQDITHGGGADMDMFLHYKNIDTDTAEDGFIDYSSAQMLVEQATKGDSVIKIVAEVILDSDKTSYETAFDAWVEGGMEGDEPELTKHTLKTGEITLTWGDDTFV